MDTEKIKLCLERWKHEWHKGDKVWKRFVRVYWEIDNKPMVELESFQIVVKQNQKLEEENKKLKDKLEQIKETYIRFEDSEKEYNKWLWELDQLIMNR